MQTQMLVVYYRLSSKLILDLKTKPELFVMELGFFCNWI